MERKRDLSSLKDWRVCILCGGCVFAGFVVGMLIFGSPWHLPPAWGDIPTWITAIATIGLLAGAIITAVYAIRAFREQRTMLGLQSAQLTEQRKINKRQTKVLRLQTAEIRASLDDRRRAQASMVFIRIETGLHPAVGQAQRAVHGPGPQTVTAYIENASDRPIYSAELIWDDGATGLVELASRSHSDRLDGVIMPGGNDSLTRESEPGTRAVALRFRDAAGITWLRAPDGELMDITALSEASEEGT